MLMIFEIGSSHNIYQTHQCVSVHLFCTLFDKVHNVRCVLYCTMYLRLLLFEVKKKMFDLNHPNIIYISLRFYPIYNTHNYISGHDVISSVDWYTINFDVKEIRLRYAIWRWLRRFKPFDDQMLHLKRFFFLKCLRACMRLQTVQEWVEQKKKICKTFPLQFLFVSKLISSWSNLAYVHPIHDLLN